MSATQKIIYAIAFQIGWFVCILGSNTASLYYSLVFVACHLAFSLYRNNALWMAKEVLWLLLIVAFGLMIETFSFSAGFLFYQTSGNFLTTNTLFESFLTPPLWLVNLWLIFAVALRTCLAFMLYKPNLLYALSLVLVPINYYAGAALNNGVALSQPYYFSLTLITLLWLVFFWCLVRIKQRYFKDMFNAR